jgi:hypothetical protein
MKKIIKKKTINKVYLYYMDYLNNLFRVNNYSTISSNKYNNKYKNKYKNKSIYNENIINEINKENDIITMLEKMNLNLDDVHQTHRVLDGVVNYKFNNYEKYPLVEFKDIEKGTYTISDWRDHLDFFLNYLLEDDLVYSMAIKGTSINHSSILEKYSVYTYGEHILITNNIDSKNLQSYVEFALEKRIFNLESPKLFDVIDPILGDTKEQNYNPNELIQFEFREVIKSKKVHKSVSNLDYTENLKEENINSEEVVTKVRKQNTEINKYLKGSPLEIDFLIYGKEFLIKDNHIDTEGNVGLLYKYNPGFEIFLYNFNEDKTIYNGIIYKNGIKYTTFIDNKADKFLLRKFDKFFLHIKNNNISYINTEIKLIPINQKKRSLIYDNNYLTYDIECYLQQNNKNLDSDIFVPYACGWYAKNNSKIYLSKNYYSWEDIIDVLSIYTI